MKLNKINESLEIFEYKSLQNCYDKNKKKMRLIKEWR